MQNSARKNNYKVQRISELLSLENGELYFSSIVEDFKSPNKDVENFLKAKSVQSTKLNTATTLSGKTVFLECEKKQKLIDFYKDKGFIALDNEIISRNSKELMQLYRLL